MPAELAFSTNLETAATGGPLPRTHPPHRRGIRARDGLLRTPARMEKSIAYLTRGYNQTVEQGPP